MSGCAVLAPVSPNGMPSGFAVGCDQISVHQASDHQACGSEIWVPRELDKATVPIYRVEPPDILTIDVMLQVPHSTYELNVGDAVALSVVGTFPEEPIAGQYVIQPGGVIDLGLATDRLTSVANRAACSNSDHDSPFRTIAQSSRFTLAFECIRNAADFR